MGVRAHRSEEEPLARRSAGAGPWPALAVAAVSFLLLLANGRPVGAAAAAPPSGWLLAAAAAAVAPFLEVDATGRALLGKGLAALFAAAAAAFVFAAAAHRRPLEDARWAAFALALGTTLAAAAQAFSGEAPAACAIAVAAWLLVRADVDDDARLAAAAGLPLALAVAFQPTAIAMALVVGAAVLARWRGDALLLLAWALPGAALALLTAMGAAVTRGASLDPGPLALLVSPAKGALVFAPVALVALAGLARALRPPARPRLWDRREPGRWLPVVCGLGAVAHFLWLAVAGGWADGIFWGPRLVAPAWPLLLLFLPEGLALLGVVGTALVLASIGVQAVGAFTYDGRWDRLFRAPSGALGDAAWDAARSPVPFQLGEGVVRPSLPGVESRKLVVREHAVVRGSGQGSFLRFGKGGLRPTGADDTMTGLRLEAGARVEAELLQLRAPGDAVAFSVREGARPRRLEVRVVGRGRGTLGLGEKSFWKAERWRERAVSGDFRLRLPYSFAESGAPDLVLALRSGGPVSIESVALVPPTEPEDVLRLP